MLRIQLRKELIIICRRITGRRLPLAHKCSCLLRIQMFFTVPIHSMTWYSELFQSNLLVKKFEVGAIRLSSHKMEQGLLLQESHKIGNHVGKLKTVTATLASLQQVNARPYQMFLSGPLSTKISIKDEELAAANAAQQSSQVRMYVHSPYIINLCQEPGTKEDYGVVCLMKNLQYANTIGLKGVVVHVGKSTKTPLALAIDYMRANLTAALAAATESCPILLETPAGQGTETLTKLNDFVSFVQSFNTPKLRICVDTCHVFATGQNPLEYIQKVYALDPTLLKLVHFNDSETPCGSCVDRHAYIGMGKLGYIALKEIADYCRDRGVPMVVE